MPPGSPRVTSPRPSERATGLHTSGAMGQHPKLPAMHRTNGRDVLAARACARLLPVPAGLVVGVGRQVGAWSEELVVEVDVEMLRL